jgi:hypothetical protein
MNNLLSGMKEKCLQLIHGFRDCAKASVRFSLTSLIHHTSLHFKELIINPQMNLFPHVRSKAICYSEDKYENKLLSFLMTTHQHMRSYSS